MRSVQMRSVALTIAMCMSAILSLTPAEVHAQSDDWTSSAEAKAHWNLAYQAMRADDNTHAAEEFRLATQADPKFAEAYYYRGLVLMQQAFVKEKKTTPPPAAAESFQMYLALRPNGSLASDSLSMLKQLGSAARSDEVTRNANTILATRPQTAPPSAPPSSPQTSLQPVLPQTPVAVQTPVAAQSRVEVPHEIAMKRPPAQAVVSSSRTNDAVAATHKASHGSSPGQSSLAATGLLSKPPSAARAAASVTEPVAASTQCVRYEITRSGQCGTPDEVEIRAWNPCAQPAAIQVCAEEKSGHWNCAMSLHSRQRKTYTGVDGARQYVCHGTGRTRALSLPSGRDLPIFPALSR